MHLRHISHEGKILMLAYDQGFEHGPKDFNEKNYDPNYVLQIGIDGGFTCVALQYGIAAKYWKGKFKQLPLVLKLNGKTNLGDERVSLANATVEDAFRLGAKAVGYTIYLGSDREADMVKEFSEIRDQASDVNLALIAWMYPFITLPSSNDDELAADIVAYAARVGGELGADAVKIKYPRQPGQLPWIIKNAVGAKAVLSGGDRVSEKQFLGQVKKFMDAGGAGVAVGRNIWQNKKPLELAAKLKKIIWE
jgi:class I fructose-bisphosphate aldolase